MDIRQKFYSMAAMALGQIVAFSISLLISRLYLPSDLGAFTLFSSAFAFLSVGLMGRYEQALIYSKGTRDTIGIVGVCLALATVSLVVIFFMGLILRDRFFSTLSGFTFFALVGASSCFLMIQKLATMLILRARDDGVIAKLNFLRPIMVPLFQSITGLLPYGVYSLIAGHIVAYLLLLTVTLCQSKKIFRFFRLVDRHALAHVTVKYKHFPFFNLPQNFLFIAGEAITPVIVSSVYGLTTGGLFWFASKIAMAPIQVLVESVRPMIYRDVASKWDRCKDIRGKLIKTCLLLGAPVLGVCILFLTFGDYFFVIVFGPNWTGAGQLAGALLVLAVMHAITVPFVAALARLSSQSVHLKFEVIATSVRIGVLYVSTELGMFWATLLSSLATGCVYIIMIAYILLLIKRNVDQQINMQ
jgi:O-antigen/teichoic acid export membrane protein